MLKRHFDTADQMFRLFHRTEQFVVHACRMQIHQPQTEVAFDPVKFIQKLRKTRFSVPVTPECTAVLGNQDQFPDAVLHQQARFFDHIFQIAAPQIPANRRNPAVGAAVVTAVRHLDIRIMGGRQLDAGSFMGIEIRRTGLFLRDLLHPVKKFHGNLSGIRHRVNAHPCIHIGKLSELGGIRPLDETPRDDHASRFRRSFFPAADSANRFRRLVPGVFEKCTGIDELNIRIRIRGCQPEPFAEKRGRRDFRIDEILRASETRHFDHAAHFHAGRIRRIIFYPAQNSTPHLQMNIIHLITYTKIHF